ncbi:lipocalin family protein [Chryseobacterium sp. POL2]|uniref:lipocalin family protein n=1 Tax=Chryseobacterium sp. POL2 TaxID=2713414 RepID=UPI0013E183AB|nr:lipocalin family protein [Chryseobacterium sp. POL2]QIG88523.1 lipocalin family protein [Chryseobacterium sp. POL2]
MKTKSFLIILNLLIGISSFGQSKHSEYKKMLNGKWEYNVAYDTIAVAISEMEKNDNFFFTDMKINNDNIVIDDSTDKWNGKWELNNNELIIKLDNRKILKYYITKLTKNEIELQEFGAKIPSLGYKKRK